MRKPSDPKRGKPPEPERATPPDDDLVELLIQKLRWLRLPGMVGAVREVLARAAAENLSSAEVISRLCDEEKQSLINVNYSCRSTTTIFAGRHQVHGSWSDEIGVLGGTA